ncbi:MAG: site-2 protease family protein [Patescibacteria group bacterium]
MIFTLLAEAGLPIVISFVLAIVVSISIHEFAHALAGSLMGDTTARDAGRLTLNPLSHLDPFGSIMLLLAGFGWGKPTPYNPYNLRYPKWGPALVALAGPAINLCGAAVSVTALAIASRFLDPSNLLIVFLLFLFNVNLMLMVFNLIPIPPLDGSQLLFTLLPARFNTLKITLMQNGPMILLGLILLDRFGGFNIFGSIFDFFARIVYWFV